MFYGYDTTYSKVLGVTNGAGFTNGPRPKGVLLVGTSATGFFHDKFGTGFTLTNGGKDGTVLYDGISPHTVNNVKTGKCFVLF